MTFDFSLELQIQVKPFHKANISKKPFAASLIEESALVCKHVMG